MAYICKELSVRRHERKRREAAAAGAQLAESLKNIFSLAGIGLKERKGWKW
jgi:hypothetical protein